MQQFREYKGWLLVVIPLVSLLLAAVLPVRGATLMEALRAGVPARRWFSPQVVTWSGFQPAGWVTTVPVTSTVTAQAPGGLDPVTARYSLSTDAGNSWSVWSAGGLSVTGTVSTTQTLAVVALNFPESSSADLIRFRIQEISGTLETSPGYMVRVDTIPPTSTVTYPTAGAVLNAAPTISGAAADGAGSGVNQVRISARNNASGLYWNGTGWGSAEQFLLATGTTTWTFNGAQPTWANGVSYVVRSAAADIAGNLETPGAGISFTYDTTPPSVKLTAPNGGEIWAGSRPYTVTWTVTDTIGLPPTPITLSVSYNGGTTWSTLAAGLPNTGSYTWTTPGTVNTNQALVQVEASDRANNRASDRSDAPFTVDSDPPAAPLNLTANPANWTNVANFSVTWTNPPDISPIAGAWYKLDSPPTALRDGTYITGTTTITGIKPAADGAHPIYVWLQDTLGRANQNAYATTTLSLDRTPPPPPSGLTGNPARRWTNINSFDEIWSNPPDVSGIVGAYYRLDRPGSYPTDGTVVSTTNTLTHIAVTGDGKHDLYIWLVDAAGNVSHLNRNVDPQVFWYDSIPPTSTLSVAVTPPLVDIGGTATDGSGSGVNQVRVSVRDNASGLYWNGTGWGSAEQFLMAAGTAIWTFNGHQPTWTNGTSYTVRSRATDIAGNLETPGSGISFTYDTTPPSVKLTAPNGGEIWAGSRPYTITWTVTDTIGLPPAPITLTVSYDGGANWATIASNLPDTDSYVWTLPGTVNTNQALVQVEVSDRGGNRVGDRSDAPFTIDSDPPAAPLNLTANPAIWTNVANFSVAWTNPPDISPIAGAWYKLDTPPTAPRDGTYITGTTTITGIKPAADGAHPIYIWLQDTLGRANQNAYATTTLSLDRTPPPPPSGLTGSPARRWTNINSFTETWINPPDVSGIVGAYYRLDQPGSYPTDGTLVHTTGTLTNIAVTGDGKHDLYIWLIDAAGNVNHINRNLDPQVFWYDGTPPTSTVALNPPLPPSGWYSTTVSVTFQGQDPPGGSGLDSVIHRIDDGPWDAVPVVQIADEGSHTIRYYARDVAANRDATKELQLALDLTPPAVTLTPARSPGATGWYTASVAFTLALTDTLSGTPRGYYRLDGGAWQAGKQFQLTSDGVHLIEYYGQDAAGNRNTVASLQARLDTTPPATAYLIEGTQGQNGWYTSPLTVKLIATDSGSGVAATYYRVNSGPWQTGKQFQLTSDGNYLLSFYSVDVAGNVETSFPVQARVDTAAPGTPIAVEVSPATWNRVNRFSVQWANPTDLSGIAGAYYRLDSEPTSPADGTFSPQINRLDGITVPGEGVHRLFLWLRDVAGNADQRNRVETPPLRYDATPPSTTAAVQGVAGTDGWYRSPVTVTLHTVDLHSGLGWLRYRLDEGDWNNTTAATALLNVVTSGKHVLEFAAEDVAGNVEPTHRMTLWIDTNPPAAPIDLRAEPVGWQHYNSFRLLWTAPLDQSGIAGAYVKFDEPPASQTDGIFHAGSEMVEGLQVPGEGKHDVYVWLRDRAGNSDTGTAVALPGALWYDTMSPVTTITQTGSLGLGGWYLGPVSFAMSATDGASGLAAIRYQVDDGAWASGDSLTLDADGMHVVRIASVDIAGNEESPHVFSVNIDRQAPLARMGTLSRYQPQPSFEVSWGGSDPVPGSGLAAFDVQMRDGYKGAWQTWFSKTTETSARFTAQRGHTYFFRVGARDVAGNQQPFTGDDTYAVIETMLNGSFDTGNFSQWTASGELFKAVIPAPGPSGNTALVARLGSDAYDPSLEDPGSVPVGSATISQMIRVPNLDQLKHPTLAFWYRVLTYDVLYSATCIEDNGLCDSFDVSLYDQAGNQALLLRDGNPTHDFGKLYDTGWKWATVDLSSYAGQTMRLDFSNWNRHDNMFNTWSYVDDIRLLDWPLYSTYLSFVTGGGGSGGAAAAAEEPGEAVPPAGLGDAKR